MITLLIINEHYNSYHIKSQKRQHGNDSVAAFDSMAQKQDTFLKTDLVQDEEKQV